MKSLKHIRGEGFMYDTVVGTGGIGTGIFFSLEGNETMGRNESRMAALLPYKDYCKQHIILHYIAVLLGAAENEHLKIYPIGKVGNDTEGNILLLKMKDAGMDTTSVGISKQNHTMFSVCYQYPDKSGGNITASNSACDEISSADIDTHFTAVPIRMGSTIMLAAPEVQVQARIALLEYGRKYNSLNVACVSSAEVQEFRDSNGILLTDILALNIDEAMKFAGIDKDLKEDNHAIADKCFSKIKAENSAIRILITCGASGVFSCDENNYVTFTPALRVPVTSTAGAGDAFLAGLICGMNCGLPLSKTRGDNFFGESPTASAVELGTIVAAMSVMSADTINSDINAATLYQFIVENNLSIGEEFTSLFHLQNASHATHSRT